MRNLWRAAVIAGFVVSVVAVGAPPASAAINTSAFCVNVRPGTTGFTDIGQVATQQRNDIECLHLSGITTGTSSTGYTPSGNAFRDSMASFVARLIDTANSLELVALVDLPAPGAVPEAFTDDEQSVHENNINRLAAARIVFGKGEGYGPNGPGNEVTRGQMAAFLVRALEFMRGAPLPAGANAFTDDNGHIFEADINKLAGLDIVDGVGDGTRFDPDGKLSRAQMASFLVRALAFLEDQNQIRVLPPGTQTIAFDPSIDMANTTDNAAGGEQAFTVSQIAATDVDVALFPCENVTIGASTTSFADATPDDNVADPGGDLVLADIVAVNGTAQPADTESVSAVAVANSAITLSIDSPSPDCVVAVVWDDADDDNALDVSGVGVPTERFGRSGQVSFRPPAATTGAMDEQVVPSDPGSGSRSFVGCELGAPNGAGATPEEGVNAVNLTDCFTFTYDDTDLFFADPDGAGLQTGAAISMAEFEAALSSGDDVAGDYNATAASQSTFRLVDESPVAPGGGSASTVDGDTINVTFNEVPGVDAYTVFRNADPGPLSCPTFTKTGADPYEPVGTFSSVTDNDADTTVLVVDNGRTPSTRYCYAVTSTDEGDESGPSATFSGSTSGDTTAPQALDTELTTSAGAGGNLDAGDFIQICFDQDIADPEGGPPVGGTTESVRLRDGDGTVATLTQGGNATFRRPAAAAVAVTAGTATACAPARVIEIQVTGAVTPTTAGGNNALNIPATIDLATDIQDTNGTRFQPAGDPDVVVDVEGTEPG